MRLMRRVATQMSRKAVQLGIIGPESAKTKENDFKNFLEHHTMRDKPGKAAVTLLASMSHTDEEVSNKHCV